MSQNLSRLCVLLIEDTYGSLCSNIFSTLATHGRLSAVVVAQKCHLFPRQIRSGLAELIQLQLIYHHTSDGRSVYQANLRAAYNIVRIGGFAQLVRRRYGMGVVSILENLLVYGHATIGTLEATSEFSNCEIVDEDSSSVLVEPAIRRLLRRMLAEDYLIAIQPAHLQTLDDTRRDVETLVRSSGTLSSAKGKKGQEELEDRVLEEMEKRFADYRSEGTFTQPSKRAAEDSTSFPTTKKQKLVNGVKSKLPDRPHDGPPEPMHTSESETVLCVNFEKMDIAFRHTRLKRRSVRSMGQRAGSVLSSILLQCEDRLRVPRENSRSPLSDRDMMNVPREINMDRLLLDVNARDLSMYSEFQCRYASINERYVNPRKVEGPVALTNGHLNDDPGATSHQAIVFEEVEEQLSMLSEGDCDFIVQDSSTGKWTLDTSSSSLRLCDEEILRMVKRRFGSIALRIIRILVDRGKVDEKTLQEIGLLNAKDVRRCLAQLSSHGFVDLQEVPREPQRQPTRTIYLWFYDAERVQQRVLEDLYKSMVRLLQRLKFERARVGATLEKVERSDVKGSEHKYLGHAEMDLLKRWRKKERWFLGELGRLDSSVVLLRND